MRRRNGCGVGYVDKWRDMQREKGEWEGILIERTRQCIFSEYRFYFIVFSE
jgi:hypothetical protein